MKKMILPLVASATFFALNSAYSMDLPWENTDNYRDKNNLSRLEGLPKLNSKTRRAAKRAKKTAEKKALEQVDSTIPELAENKKINVLNNPSIFFRQSPIEIQYFNLIPNANWLNEISFCFKEAKGGLVPGSLMKLNGEQHYFYDPCKDGAEIMGLLQADK